MAQAQRSLRQIIAIRHSLARRNAAGPVAKTPGSRPDSARRPVGQAAAAVTGPSDATSLEGYTILTPIVNWRSSRSRKRVVKRVKNGPIIGKPSEKDIAMLLAHDAYAVLGTIPRCAELPVRTSGGICVSNATGRVFAMGRSHDEIESGDRVFFQGTAICMPTSLTVDPDTLATRPAATELARSRSDALTEATRACNLRYSRQR